MKTIHYRKYRLASCKSMRKLVGALISIDLEVLCAKNTGYDPYNHVGSKL